MYVHFRLGKGFNASAPGVTTRACPITGKKVPEACAPMLVVVLGAPHRVTSARITIVVVAPVYADDSPIEQCRGALEEVVTVHAHL